MKYQRCYGGVRLLGDGPSMVNIARLDHNARPMIHAMMKVGMRVDPAHFRMMHGILSADMEEITEDVHGMTGRYVNLDSGDQVADLLFKRLGLKQVRPKFTPSGDRESVEYEVLSAIQHEHPVVGKILLFKEYSKLKGTYVENLLKMARKVGPGHYRIYPNLGDTRIPSGRLNCKEPNLLAMPNKSKRGKQMCEGFICEDGWVYVSVDESQIEVRIAAHRSGDETLIQCYEDKQDVYSDFATTAFKLADKRYRDEKGWHYPGIDKDKHRFPAKTCFLASIYEVTGKGLLEQMPSVCKTCHKQSKDHTPDCPSFESTWNEDNCDKLIQDFGLKYHGLIRGRIQDHRRMRKYGYSWDDWGRLLHTIAVKSVHPWVASAGLREGGNLPVQGTAQGTVKLTMAEVFDTMEGAGLSEVVIPQLQVHDELLFACREDFAAEWIEYVSSVFRNCVQLRVPIEASGAYAPTWGSLQK